jgi:hypothetical protein
MTILRTSPDTKQSAADRGQPATFRNRETHWWDASQIYGSSIEQQTAVRTDPATQRVREDGKLHLTPDGRLPIDTDSKIPDLELSGVNGSWWIGLSILHTLFAREHNAIVERLRINYPDQSGEWLFHKARLVRRCPEPAGAAPHWLDARLGSHADPRGRSLRTRLDRPAHVRGPNLIGILGRFWMGTVWLFIGGGFLWLAAFEYVFGLLIARLYWRAWRDDLMSYL